MNKLTDEELDELVDDELVALYLSHYRECSICNPSLVACYAFYDDSNQCSWDESAERATLHCLLA